MACNDCQGHDQMLRLDSAWPAGAKHNAILRGASKNLVEEIQALLCSDQMFHSVQHDKIYVRG
ncbi:MAG TPA: hypothetical protein DCF78_03935, partial [Dehalococcoidia bacterium]|nr:hypothetical protein [Dehalococcoidia bacterium]